GCGVPKARVALLTLACVCASLPGVAAANQSARLRVGLRPERLGRGSTIVFAFRLSSPTSTGAPSPLRDIDLSYPGTLGFATSGLGLENCSVSTLQRAGPGGCPVDSRVGYGSAVVEVPFGSRVIAERATIDTFMAPLREGQLSLLYYARGTSPLLAQLVFPAALSPGPTRGNLDTSLPVVPTLPAAPDAAVVALTSTIGPAHILYHRNSHGHVVSYRPRGLMLPRVCPRGGFRFAADFAFDDGSHTSAEATVPCPRGS
ncbi:MAG TPA: hypothetical protein VMG62_00600, partial [Solirubrobacteraceae bacterium]|nr:hypothetical protein [Solirubrobacteraceae bacterium]